MNIVAKNMVSALPIQDKFDCRIFHTFRMLKTLAKIGFHWVEFFPFTKLKNGCTG